jgi:hypothetical protein
MFAVAVEIAGREELQIIQQRDFFTFDYDVPKPTDFFRGVAGIPCQNTRWDIR